MNSHDYWVQREAEQLKHNITEEAEYDKHIQKIYADMIEQCNKEIAQFYARYADKEGITIADAKKRASKVDIEEFARKAKQYVDTKDFSDQANEEMRLYNLTMKVNRLELLKARLGLETVSSFDELQKYYDQILTDRSIDTFKHMSGILGHTVHYNERMANDIVNASFHNATFSQRIWAHQDLLRSALDRELTSGLITGKHPTELARSIRKQFNTSRFNAERLMITEMARVEIGAQERSLTQSGFEEYQIIEVDDSHTCDDCREMNGKHFKISEMQVGENAPPFHPFCRGSVAAWVDEKLFDDWLDSGAAKEGIGLADFRDGARPKR